MTGTQTVDARNLDRFLFELATTLERLEAVAAQRRTVGDLSCEEGILRAVGAVRSHLIDLLCLLPSGPAHDSDPEPNACEKCGTPQRGHGRRWWSGVGFHTYVIPSDDTRLARMKDRRARRARVVFARKYQIIPLNLSDEDLEWIRHNGPFMAAGSPDAHWTLPSGLRMRFCDIVGVYLRLEHEQPALFSPLGVVQ